jgi:hypothetical protein
VFWLPIIHHILLEYSSSFRNLIKDYDLYGKTDGRFMQIVYKLLLERFQYKPKLLLQQFFHQGFAEQKCLFIVDIIGIVKDVEQKSNKARNRIKQASAFLAKPKEDQVKIKLPEPEPLPILDPLSLDESFYPTQSFHSNPLPNHSLGSSNRMGKNESFQSFHDDSSFRDPRSISPQQASLVPFSVSSLETIQNPLFQMVSRSNERVEKVEQQLHAAIQKQIDLEQVMNQIIRL